MPSTLTKMYILRVVLDWWKRNDMMTNNNIMPPFSCSHHACHLPPHTRNISHLHCLPHQKKKCLPHQKRRLHLQQHCQHKHHDATAHQPCSQSLCYNQGTTDHNTTTCTTNTAEKFLIPNDNVWENVTQWICSASLPSKVRKNRGGVVSLLTILGLVWLLSVWLGNTVFSLACFSLAWLSMAQLS